MMLEAGKGGESIIHDEHIIERILAGDQQAFRLLIDRYRHYMYRIMYAILRNEKDAEDATQEAWIKIYYALPQYESQGFKTWITRIAVNHAIDLKRKFNRQRDRALQWANEEIVSVHGSEETEVETPLIRKEKRALVQERIQELPPHYRDVVIAYYIQEKSYKEIAQEWNVEVKTIETKLYRARNWIRKHWKEDDFE